MNWLFKLAWHFLELNAKRRLLKEINRKGLVAYLRFLNASRRLLATVLGLFVFLQLMIISFVGALVTGVLRWTPDAKTQLEILFFAFCAMFVFPAIILLVAFSEKLWFKVSGAQKLVDKARE